MKALGFKIEYGAENLQNNYLVVDLENDLASAAAATASQKTNNPITQKNSWLIST